LEAARPPLEEPVAGNYFVAAYPPFSCWQPAAVPAVERMLSQPVMETPLGLYVHLPFCPQKCGYCYYLSYIRQPGEVVDHYLDLLLRELELYARRPALRQRRVPFVYFGGGTPSTLSTAQVRHLIGGLQNLLPWEGTREITYECAPRSVRPNFLDALGELGVNRLSMGVQSLDDDLLRLNGRVHLAADVFHAWELLRQARFAWTNLDLMAGLIGETDEQWQDTVRKIIALGPDSVTLYQTEMPRNTQLYRDYMAGTLPAEPVPWETKHARVGWAFAALEQAGYTVVNAYAAVKDPSRHRLLYQRHLWGGDDMLGLGVSSFSYAQGFHFQNECTLETYAAALTAGRLPVGRGIELTPEDRLTREFILQLKFGHVSCAPLKARFGTDPIARFQPLLHTLQTDDFLVVSQDAVTLTRRGLLCVDRWLPRFYHPKHQTAGYW
jgi:oxygen-independent coproporphyrinogen-3 oxidase